jgi:hypothetical protein
MKPSDVRSIKSVDCAVSRYVRSVRRGSVPCRTDGDANSQAANYRDAAERAELRAEQIRRILNERGVSLNYAFVELDSPEAAVRACLLYKSDAADE